MCIYFTASILVSSPSGFVGERNTAGSLALGNLSCHCDLQSNLKATYLQQYNRLCDQRARFPIFTVSRRPTPYGWQNAHGNRSILVTYSTVIALQILGFHTRRIELVVHYWKVEFVRQIVASRERDTQAQSKSICLSHVVHEGRVVLCLDGKEFRERRIAGMGRATYVTCRRTCRRQEGKNIARHFLGFGHDSVFAVR